MINRLSDEELEMVKENALTLKDKLNNLLAKVPDFVNNLDVVDDGVTALQNSDLVNQLINTLTTNADQLLPLLQGVVGSKEEGKVSEGKMLRPVQKTVNRAGRQASTDLTAAAYRDDGAKIRFSMKYIVIPLCSTGEDYQFTSPEEEKTFANEMSECVSMLATETNQKQGQDSYLNVLIHLINSKIEENMNNAKYDYSDSEFMNRGNNSSETFCDGYYDTNDQTLTLVITTTLRGFLSQADAEQVKEYVDLAIEETGDATRQVKTGLTNIYKAKGTIEDITGFDIALNDHQIHMFQSFSGDIKANKLLRRLIKRLFA